MHILSLLLMIALPGVARAQIDYFPLHTDALWTYGGSPMEIARTLTMQATSDSSSGVYSWDGPFGRRTVRLNDDGQLIDVAGDTETILLDFSAEPGASWTIDLGDDILTGSLVSVESRDVEKSVSFGAFENVLHFAVTPPAGLRDAGLTDLWFAPKIGLIAYEEVTIAGPQTYELAAMAIPGGEPTPIPVPLPEPVDPGNLFPVSIGLTWNYEGPLDDDRQLRMIESTTAAGKRALVLTGLMGDRVVRANDGRIEQFSSDAWRLLFDLDAEVGASWVIDLEAVGSDFLDGATVEVLEKGSRLEVPYGILEGVTHLRLTAPPGLADAGLTELWLAPGLGIAAWTEQSIAGPRTYSLVSFANRYEPEPFPEPVPDPIVPHEEFTHRNESERDGVLYTVGTTSETVRQGETLFLEYLAVGLEGERTYHFNSTQQVEFWLRDQDGTVKWVWSELFGFGDALTQFTIAAGDSVRSVEQLDTRLKTLPPGDYTLTGFLPTDDVGSPTVNRVDTEVSVTITILGDPEFAELEGVVRDEDDAPVSDVVVSAYLVGASTSEVAVPAIASFTGREGFFRIGRVRPGTYRLTASRRGYASASKTVEVVPGVNSVALTIAKTGEDGFTNVHTVSNEKLLIEVATERNRYAVGDTLRVRYEATNITDSALPMVFPSGQEFDLTVSGASGVIYTWSAARSFVQVITETELPAGERFTFEATEIIPPTWAGHGTGLVLEAFLAVSNLEESGGLSRGLTRGYVKFAFGESVHPHPGPDGLTRATVETDRSSYAAGDTVIVNYALKNVHEEPLTLLFSSGQRYDLTLVNGASGEHVWTWSMNKLFDQATHEEQIAAGDTYAFTEAIDLSTIGPIRDGVYILQAYLTVSDVGGHVQLENTRAVRRLWVGERPPAEEPPRPGGRVARSLDLNVEADSVTATYVVANHGGKDIPLLFPSGQTFEIELRDGEDVVWRWSDGLVFTQAVRNEVLGAVDSIVVRERFASPDAAGTFEVRAYLTVVDGTDGGNLTRDETIVRRQLFISSGENNAVDAQFRRSDFDGSGNVDFGDFIAFAIAFGTRSGDFAFDAAFDLDDDGQVGFSDFLSFSSAFGATVSTR